MRALRYTTGGGGDESLALSLALYAAVERPPYDRDYSRVDDDKESGDKDASDAVDASRAAGGLHIGKGR